MIQLIVGSLITLNIMTNCSLVLVCQMFNFYFKFKFMVVVRFYAIVFNQSPIYQIFLPFVFGGI